MKTLLNVLKMVNLFLTAVIMTIFLVGVFAVVHAANDMMHPQPVPSAPAPSWGDPCAMTDAPPSYCFGTDSGVE